MHFVSELGLERSCGVFLDVERASFLRRGFAIDGGLNGDGVGPDQLDDHVGDVGVQAISDISALTSQVKRVTSWTPIEARLGVPGARHRLVALRRPYVDREFLAAHIPARRARRAAALWIESPRTRLLLGFAATWFAAIRWPALLPFGAIDKKAANRREAFIR